MPVYLVTWNLNKEKQNYARARDEFLSHLARYENTKDSGLDSVRFIFATSNADQVSNDLRLKLDDNDRIIVTKMIKGNHQGWLSEVVWNWINTRL